ncbi:MAG: glutathione S-transferase [Mangrovicoccus sp.]|nr:glutathione S-transferase [Mangrovicoccus sp.]
MTALTLYHSPTSPYVRKVMIVLHETGQLGDVTLTHAQGTPLDASAMPLAQNPLGKVPTLARADGPALFDSRVICQYLDDRAKSGLYGSGPRRWEILSLEALGDGMLDAAVGMVYEARLRPEERRSPEIVEGLWAKVDRGLDMLETRWMGHLAGPLDAGQIAIGAALGYLDFRQAPREWRKTRPNLAQWFGTGFARRESFIATAPPAGA